MEVYLNFKQGGTGEIRPDNRSWLRRKWDNVITAYNSSEIAYIVPLTGEQKNISMNDAAKMFSQGGNVYVTYYK